MICIYKDITHTFFCALMSLPWRPQELWVQRSPLTMVLGGTQWVWNQPPWNHRRAVTAMCEALGCARSITCGNIHPKSNTKECFGRDSHQFGVWFVDHKELLHQTSTASFLGRMDPESAGVAGIRVVSRYSCSCGNFRSDGSPPALL